MAALFSSKPPTDSGRTSRRHDRRDNRQPYRGRSIGSSIAPRICLTLRLLGCCGAACAVGNVSGSETRYAACGGAGGGRSVLSGRVRLAVTQPRACFNRTRGVTSTVKGRFASARLRTAPTHAETPQGTQGRRGPGVPEKSGHRVGRLYNSFFLQSQVPMLQSSSEKREEIGTVTVFPIEIEPARSKDVGHPATPTT